MNLSHEDIDIVARTLYGETRGESWPGKIAVAWVIRNRVELSEKRILEEGREKWWGRGYINVCLKPFQFSCWNENDPNRAKLQTVTLETEAIFRECYAAAALVLSGGIPDPTSRSFHYINPKHARADWFVGKEHCFSTGKHIFFNNVK